MFFQSCRQSIARAKTPLLPFQQCARRDRVSCRLSSTNVDFTCLADTLGGDSRDWVSTVYPIVEHQPSLLVLQCSRRYCCSSSPVSWMIVALMLGPIDIIVSISCCSTPRLLLLMHRASLLRDFEDTDRGTPAIVLPLCIDCSWSGLG